METPRPAKLRLFLCGDVMTGRGIDQALPYPCDPRLHESYMDSAIDYVRLAERANGPIPRPVDFSYVWGAALDDLARADLRIVNLETSITRSEDYADKGINYRMSPENIGCLVAAGIDCCVLANNHVLDWGRAGLVDTLDTLARAGVKSAGAGRNRAEAAAPAVLDAAGKGRAVVLAFASPTSGTPARWAAGEDAPGVSVLTALTEASVARIGEEVARIRRPNDVVIVSLHWGPNWGYEVAAEQRRFAHALVEQAGASIVHGHSSHHAKAIEVYRDRLILYGCGDFLTDYEGISGHEEFRDDLVAAYFAEVDPGSGKLTGLEIVPLQLRRFRLTPAAGEDAEWLRAVLDRESRRFGTRIDMTAAGRLVAA